MRDELLLTRYEGRLRVLQAKETVCVTTFELKKGVKRRPVS